MHVYEAPGEKTSPLWCQAFAQGSGGTLVQGREVPTLQPGPVALWGSPQLWPLLMQAQLEKRTWFYGDHAYMGRRKFYRVTRNRFQHPGTGTPTREARRRFAKIGRPVQPWRITGRHVLICPNSAAYFSLFGLDVTEWIADVSRVLAAHTDRPLRVRWKGDTKDRPIATDLRDAWAVVTFSSASAIDALIAGVPVFTTADFAATWRMGLSHLPHIERPIYPEDREDFLAVLAGEQWSLDEIARGDAWRHLCSEN